MKPRFKTMWISPGKEKSSELETLMNDGWQIFYGLPTETSIFLVLSKMTDALDGLSMAVDTALTKEKNVNKLT